MMEPRGEGGSRVHQVMEAVTRHIRQEALRVGDTLPGEAHFAASQGVSRAVIREAFGALAALRLIDVGNGRKPRVAAMDGSVMATSLDHAVSTAQVTVAEVWDVRRTLERRTVELAARHRTQAEAERIRSLAEAMASQACDLEAVTRLDIAFHHEIASASRNALFLQTVSSFAPLMRVAVPAAWRTRITEAQRELMLERHRRVAQAIVDRDTAAAIAGMENHFDVSIGDVLRAAHVLAGEGGTAAG